MRNNTKAVLLEGSRTEIREGVFFETVLWHLPRPTPGSAHSFKYRFALVVDGECVMRYDNERGKGDHRHIGELEYAFEFTTLDALLAAFDADVKGILG